MKDINSNNSVDSITVDWIVINLVLIFLILKTHKRGFSALVELVRTTPPSNILNFDLESNMLA